MANEKKDRKSRSETPPAYREAADRGYGFPRGCYFFIKEQGTANCLLNDYVSHTEGTLLHLWPLQHVKDVRRRNQVRIVCVLYVDIDKLIDIIPAVLY